MPGIKRRRIVLALAVLAVIGAFAWEILRQRPEFAAPVSSPRPSHANELARLEGGFSWATTRAGERVFGYNADSLLAVEGGLRFLEGIRSLRVYLEDGRAVEVSADRARIEQGDARTADQELVVVLYDNVIVRDPDGLELFTEELNYETKTGLMSSPGETRVVADRLDAVFGALVYRPSGRVIEAKGTMQLKLGNAPRWRIEAPRADYRLTTGEIVFPEALRVLRQGQAMVAGSANLRPERRGRAGRLESGGPVMLRGEGESSRWQVAAAELLVEGLPADGGQPESVELGSPSTIIFERETTQTVRVRATRWLLSPEGEGAWKFRGGPGFEIDWKHADGEDLTEGSVEGRTLEILRDPLGQVTSIVGQEDVRFTDSGGAVADADRFDWSMADENQIVLLGEPARVWQKQDKVEAPRLILLRREQVLVGEGGVQTEIGSMERGENALFPGDEPVRITAERVYLPQKGQGEILFEGSAHAWQGTTMLSAKSMRLFQVEQRLLADGQVSVRLEVGEEGEAKRTIRVLGDHLEYDGRTRIATITDNARFERPGSRIRADKIVIERGPADVGFKSLDATGSVLLVFEDQDRKATGKGDRLSWVGDQEGTVILSGEKELASLRLPAGQSVEAAVIRYDISTGEYSTESGGGRSVIEKENNGSASGSRESDSEGQRE